MGQAQALPWLSSAGSELSGKVRSGKARVEDIDRCLREPGSQFTENDVLYFRWIIAVLNDDDLATREALSALRDSHHSDLATLGAVMMRRAEGEKDSEQGADAQDLPWLSPAGCDLRRRVKSREIKAGEIDGCVDSLGKLLTPNDILYFKWVKAALNEDHPAIREALFAFRDSDDPDLALFGRMIVDAEYGEDGGQ